MSQQFRRIRFEDFVRHAERIFDDIQAKGETVLVERGGTVFVISPWQANHRRRPAKPHPANMQDSLWSVGRSEGISDATPTFDPRPKGEAETPSTAHAPNSDSHPAAPTKE